MKTRLLSLAAACALVFTMLPCTALGAEVPAQYTTSTGKTISVQKISDSAAEKLRGASYMGEGIFSYYENGAYHFMDENGNELGKVDDADIMMDSYFYDGRCKAYVFDPYTAKYAYGYLDKTGKIAIAAQYSDAYAFSDGLALVKKGDSFGYIDTAGNVVIPFQYYMATDFHDGYAAVAYYLDGNEHQKHVEIINTKGETVWESPMRPGK